MMPAAMPRRTPTVGSTWSIDLPAQSTSVKPVARRHRNDQHAEPRARRGGTCGHNEQRAGMGEQIEAEKEITRDKERRDLGETEQDAEQESRPQNMGRPNGRSQQTLKDARALSFKKRVRAAADREQEKHDRVTSHNPCGHWILDGFSGDLLCLDFHEPRK